MTGGCQSKPGVKKASDSGNTPQSASTPSTDTAENQAMPDSVGTDSEKAGAKPAIDACALLEKSEIASVQGQEIKETKLSSREGGGQLLASQCFYVAASFDKSVSLEVTERDPKNPDRNAIQDFWKERFRASGAERDKEKGEENEGSTPPKLVTGVGEEAYWTGDNRVGALYALKKNKILRISIGGPGDANQKIEKLKTLAVMALGRLN